MPSKTENLVTAPAYCADREEARVRVREAAYQAIQRHQVTERYRYYVPVSAFAQRRGDEAGGYSWRAMVAEL